jgi:hypothetical protein
MVLPLIPHNVSPKSTLQNKMPMFYRKVWLNDELPFSNFHFPKSSTELLRFFISQANVPIDVFYYFIVVYHFYLLS